MRIGKLIACAFLLSSGSASAFSQSSPVFPIGHEAVTVLGAHNSAGFRALPKPVLTPTQVNKKDLCLSYGAVDPRTCAKDLCLSYGAVDPRTCAAVLGVRWVDIMGFNVILGNSDYECFKAVAQDQDASMYDHFLRKEADEGEEGRKRAYAGSVAMYRSLVGQAVRSDEAWTSDITDGGARQTPFKDVPMSYFLLGRAMHLLQDSFSSEHAQRYIKRDQGRAVSSIVIDLASYRCIGGVYKEHSHDYQVRAIHEGVTGQYALKYSLVGAVEHGDIIWNAAAAPDEKAQLAVLLKGDTRNPTYLSTFVKATATDAVFATADLFDTFLAARAARAAGSKTNGDKLIEAHVQKWFALSKKGMPVSRTAADVAACKKAIEPMAVITARRDACLLQTCPNGKKRADGAPCTNQMPGEKHKPPFSWVGDVDDIK